MKKTLFSAIAMGSIASAQLASAAATDLAFIGKASSSGVVSPITATSYDMSAFTTGGNAVVTGELQNLSVSGTLTEEGALVGPTTKGNTITTTISSNKTAVTNAAIIKDTLAPGSSTKGWAVGIFTYDDAGTEKSSVVVYRKPALVAGVVQIGDLLPVSDIVFPDSTTKSYRNVETLDKSGNTVSEVSTGTAFVQVDWDIAGIQGSSIAEATETIKDTYKPAGTFSSQTVTEKWTVNLAGIN